MIKKQQDLLKLMSISLMAMAVATGCSVSTKKTVNVMEPISTIMGSEKDVVNIDEDKIPRSIAVMPLVNKTGDDIAIDILRSTIQNHFASKNFQLMNWQEVDNKLAFWDDPSSLDPKLAANALGVDGLVSGNVKQFRLLHAGIYAEISMTVELTLTNDRGETLWTLEENVTTRAGGVSTTPWGLLMNAATATLHLSEKNMLAAADQLGRSIAKQIPQPTGYQGKSGPYIDQVMHDSNGKTLNYGDKLQLGLRGEPGQRATVSIDGIQTYDLEEIEDGVYLTTVTVSNQWNSEGSMIVGRLTNALGNVTTWASPAGLVSFDNIAPAPVYDVKLASSGEQNTLSWLSGDSDSVTYNVYRARGETRELLGSTENTSLPLNALPLFEETRFEIEALDVAGNASSAAVLSSIVYPMAGVELAKKAASKIDHTQTDSILLSAANSPFTLNGQLRIPAGNQLYVEPGVEINMTQNGSIKIEGDAWFWGEDKGITIKSASNKAPAEFINMNSDGTIQMQNVSVSNGNIGISIKRGSPALKHVKFNNNQYNAVIISGSASPTFEHCHFEGSMTAGVVVSDYAKPSFSESVFKNNRPFHIQSSAVYEVVAENNQWEPKASPASVLGNVRY